LKEIDLFASYKKYISHPLATHIDYKINPIYKNKWCNIVYESLICEPHRHVHFSLDEFEEKINQEKYKEMKDMFGVYNDVLCHGASTFRIYNICLKVKI
jgi:hypothetical protein